MVRFKKEDHAPLIFCTLLFLAALAVRLIFHTLVLDIIRPLEGDEGIYFSRALNLSEGNWIGTTQRPPLLGAVLAPFYVFGDETYATGRFVNILISATACPLIYILGRDFIESENAGRLAGIIWLFYPPSIWYAGTLLTEPLSGFLVTFIAVVFIKYLRNPTLREASILGMLMGLLVLNRSLFIGLFIPILLFLFARNNWGWINKNKGKKVGLKNIKICFIFTSVFLLVLFPWIMHNYISLGKFVPHSTQGGQVLMYSNEQLMNEAIQSGFYIKDNETFIGRVDFDLRDEYKSDSLKRSIAIESIMSNWKNLPKPVVNRFKNFWTSRPDPYDVKWTTNDFLMSIIWMPLIVFFLIGVYKNRISTTVPLLLLISYTCIAVLPFWGTPRFRYPVDSLVVVLAVSGFISMCSIFKPNLFNRLMVSR